MKKADFIVIACVLTAALAIFLGLHFGANEGGYAIVEVNSKQVEAFSLKENTSYEIKTENGNNTLIIENGKAYIKDADCPDKICVHHSPVSKNGESIICLPHKVVITIKKDKGGVDAVA